MSRRTGVRTGDVAELGLDPADAGGHALWGENDLDAVVTGVAGAGEVGKTILVKELAWWMGLAFGADALEPQLFSGAPGDGLYIGLLFSGDATVLGRTEGIAGGIFSNLWLHCIKGFSVGHRLGTIGIWKRAGLLTHSWRAFWRRLTWRGLEAMPTRAIISKNSSSPASHSCCTSSPPEKGTIFICYYYDFVLW